MSIKSQFLELEEINKEIKALSIKISSLRKEKLKIEKEVMTYLYNNDHPGIKFNDKAIVIDSRTTTVAKTEDNKYRNIKEVLEFYQIDSTDDELINRIVNATKGEKIRKDVLKFVQAK